VRDELVVTPEPARVLEGPAQLRERFDVGVGRPRLLALVSPTCPVCLDGVALVIGGLRNRGASDIAVHIAWMPVLEADSAERAKAAAEALEADGRVWQYWDAYREISTWAYDALDLGRYGRSVAWDLYLFYRAGARWRRSLPAPETWLHQLRIVDQPSLDPETLRAALESVSS
jgi:hypothetical protein